MCCCAAAAAASPSASADASANRIHRADAGIRRISGSYSRIGTGPAGEGEDRMKIFGAIVMAAAALALAPAVEPDGLTLPAGFHATIVADGLGAIRHLAVRGNGNIYLSTAQSQDGKGSGIVALHLDASHHADRTEHFGAIDGGTGIR